MKRRLILNGLVAAAALWAISAINGGQIFVTSLGLGPDFQGTIGEYTTSGATINPALISGLKYPKDIAVSGDKLFVADALANTIREYTTSGETVNPALITGLEFPTDVALFEGHLFIVNSGSTIGEYTTSGETVNPALISGLDAPQHIAIVSESLPVPDAPSTWTLLLLGLTATFGLKPSLRRA